MKWRSLEEAVPQPESLSLQEVYAERKALIAKYVPADVQSVHTRAVAELQQAGIANQALAPGGKAPEFELPDHNGKATRSTDLLAQGTLVLCFFRGRWCPFCVGQLEATNAIMPQLKALGASLVALSPQTVHQCYLMADQHKLSFPLLSDSGNKVAKQFGLVYCVPAHQQEIYRRVFVNLPFVNGDESWELPIPASYIVHSDGMVAHAWADADYTHRPEPADILGHLSVGRR